MTQEITSLLRAWTNVDSAALDGLMPIVGPNCAGWHVCT
jgi:hypothetical protein